MPNPTTHLLLTPGTDRTDAQARTQHFFAKNFLVKYDRVTVLAERTINAGEAEFWKRLRTVSRPTANWWESCWAN